MPSDLLHVIESSRELDGLAGLIMDPGRRMPLLVLSVRSRDRRAGWDPYTLADILSGTNTLVYLMADPRDGGRLGLLTGGRVTCYNGAAALIPPHGRPTTFLPDRDTLDLVAGRTLACATFDRPRSTHPDDNDDGIAGDRRLEGLRAENHRLRARLRHAAHDGADTHPDPLPDPALYPACMAGEWLDLAIRLMWAQTIPAADKPHRPLPGTWLYADGLAGRLHAHPDREVIRMMARTLVGLDAGARAARRAERVAGRQGRVGRPHMARLREAADARRETPPLHAGRRRACGIPRLRGPRTDPPCRLLTARRTCMHCMHAFKGERRKIGKKEKSQNRCIQCIQGLRGIREYPLIPYIPRVSPLYRLSFHALFVCITDAYKCIQNQTSCPIIHRSFTKTPPSGRPVCIVCIPGRGRMHTMPARIAAFRSACRGACATPMERGTP